MGGDEIDIEHYRAKLLAQHEALLGTEDSRRQAGAVVELDQTRTGRLSRMDALQQQAMAQAGQARAEAVLQRIEAALARCDSGEYGDCLKCEEPIDRRRLDVDPATTLCLACAQARERN